MGKDFLVTDRLRNWSRHKKRKIVSETDDPFFFFFFFPTFLLPSLMLYRLDGIPDNKWHKR